MRRTAPDPRVPVKSAKRGAAAVRLTASGHGIAVRQCPSAHAATFLRHHLTRVAFLTMTINTINPMRMPKGTTTASHGLL